MLVTDGPRCAAHRSQQWQQYDNHTRNNDPRLAEAHRIRSSKQWQDVRAIVKASNPLCCNPYHQHGDDRITEHVHHITPLIERPDLAFTYSNLAPVCIACHNTAEALERMGKADRTVFDGVIVSSPFGPVTLICNHAA